MKILLVHILLLVFSFSLPLNAHAASCSDRARSLVASTPNASLVTVQTTQNSSGQTVCVVSMKINKNDGKPPRIVTREFKL